jgi:hypothetical protein
MGIIEMGGIPESKENAHIAVTILTPGLQQVRFQDETSELLFRNQADGMRRSHRRPVLVRFSCEFKCHGIIPGV